MAIGRSTDDNSRWRSSASSLLDACHDAGFSG
jgi:hypothetical protein